MFRSFLNLAKKIYRSQFKAGFQVNADEASAQPDEVPPTTTAEQPLETAAKPISNFSGCTKDCDLPGFSSSKPKVSKRHPTYAELNRQSVFPRDYMRTGDRHKQSYVYILQSKPGESIYKIGKTTDLRIRLRELRKAHPYAFFVSWKTVTGEDPALDLERDLHMEFSGKRDHTYNGQEWFKFDAEEILALQKRFGVSRSEFDNVNQKQKTRKPKQGYRSAAAAQPVGKFLSDF